MTAPTWKDTTMTTTTPRKTAAKKTPAPAPDTDDAAADEAIQEVSAEDADVIMPFRGAEFVIPAARRKSFRFAMAIASRNDHEFIYQLLGPADVGRAMMLAGDTEDFAAVATELYLAYQAASGQGNS